MAVANESATSPTASPGRMLVFYPGHLGPQPAVAWKGREGLPFDGPSVRELPSEVGRDLVRYSGFLEAVLSSDVASRFVIPAEAAAALPKRQFEIRPKEMVELVILDAAARAAIHSAQKASGSPAIVRGSRRSLAAVAPTAPPVDPPPAAEATPTPKKKEN